MPNTIHYYSGLTVALYVGVHLLNHLFILHSEAMHIKFMRAARTVYRHPVVEGVLLSAVVVQIFSGIFLVTQKWSRAEGWFDWMQISSGLYLALFLANHVRAVIVGRRTMHIDTDLYYGAGVMNMWPQKLFYIPYYAIAVLSFYAHVASVHRVKMQEFVRSEVAEHQAEGIVILGCVVTFLIIFRMSRLKIPSSLTRGGDV